MAPNPGVRKDYRATHRRCLFRDRRELLNQLAVEKLTKGRADKHSHRETP
jgi:hypothetical protein